MGGQTRSLENGSSNHETFSLRMPRGLRRSFLDIFEQRLVVEPSKVIMPYMKLYTPKGGCSLILYYGTYYPLMKYY